MATLASSSDSAVIAEALGVVLQRRFRSGLYATLTANVHAAVDEASYPVLSGVARLGPISAAALSQQVGLDRSVVSRRAAPLVAAGLLAAGSDPNDARASLLSLTSSGRRVVAILRRRLIAAIDDHLAEWTDEQRHLFAQLMAKFAEPGAL